MSRCSAATAAASPIAARRLNECPLGAAALAGTSFPIDRDATAAALGFDRPTANSLDAVSDRDFALEFLAAAAICAIHLSRLAEEIVLWCQRRLPLHPPERRLHHRQLDHAAEEQPRRGRTGARQGRPGHRRAGRACCWCMKGLPLAYSKDMQEDKEPVFEAADTLELCLAAMAGMVARPDARYRSGMRAAAAAASSPRPISPTGWSAMLDLPFREAHHVTGALVKLAEDGRRRPRRTAARRDAADRAAHHRRRVRRADGRRLGRQPHQLRRHRARQCAAAPRRGAFPVTQAPGDAHRRRIASRLIAAGRSAARNPGLRVEPPQGRASRPFPRVFPTPAALDRAASTSAAPPRQRRPRPNAGPTQPRRSNAVIFPIATACCMPKTCRCPIAADGRHPVLLLFLAALSRALPAPSPTPSPGRAPASAMR